jgi:hypothetical protein
METLSRRTFHHQVARRRQLELQVNRISRDEIVDSQNAIARSQAQQV